MAMACALFASCAGGPPAPSSDPRDPFGLGYVPVELCVYDGCPVSAFVVGDPSADRRVVFVHGWAGTGAELLPLAERLVALLPGTACFCVDMPGTGSSGKPADAPYDVPWLAGAVGAAVEAAATYGRPAGEPAADVTLVGHSQGGHFSIAWATSAPADRLPDRIALLAPLGWPGESGLWAGWASRSRFVAGLASAFMTERLYVAMNRARVVYDPASIPDPQAWYGARSATSPDGKRALRAVTLNAVEEDTIEGVLGSLRPPIFMAWGRNDKVLPFRYAAKFLATLPPGTRFLEFDRCGHLPHLERTEDLAQALASFIAGD